MSDPDGIDPATAEALQNLSDAALQFMIGNLAKNDVALEGVMVSIVCKSGHSLTSEAVAPDGVAQNMRDAVRGFLDGENDEIAVVTYPFAAGGHA